MKQLALTPEGDLSIFQDDLVVIENVLDIKQSLQILFATNLNEWFLNREFGTDFSLLTGKPTDEHIRAEVVRVISEEPRVRMIEDVSITQDRKSRILQVHFVVTTTDGETVEMEVPIDA